MLQIPDFLAAFPEFGEDYEQGAITRWLAFAQTVVNAKRWGALYNMGVFLLTAHYITLYKNGNGETEGLDTGQTVDGVSYTTVVSEVTLEGAGMYNKTIYGIQFLQFARMRGNGPLSALGGCYGSRSY